MWYITLYSNDVQWNIITDLCKYKIGVASGYSYGNEFDNTDCLKSTVEAVTLEEQNLKKLLAKTIDITFMDDTAATYLIRKNLNSSSKLIKLGTRQPLTSLSVHLVCSKNNTSCYNVIRKFNEGLRILNADGTIDSIVRKSLVY